MYRNSTSHGRNPCGFQKAVLCNLKRGTETNFQSTTSGLVVKATLIGHSDEHGELDGSFVGHRLF